jgi:hypothetical protein
MRPKPNTQRLNIIVQFLDIVFEYWLAYHQRGGGKGADGLADV